MKKFYLLTIVLLLLNIGLQAQKKNQPAEDPIKTSGQYYWGDSGKCSKPNESKKLAMKNLITNIKENYKGQAQLLPEITDTHFDLIYQSFEADLEQVSKTKCLDLQNNIFMRYIPKKVFDSLCDDRKEQIYSSIHRGLEMEAKESMGDALRSYYKALMLCYSHPKGKAIKYTTDDGVEHQVINWLIEDKIDGDEGILKNMKFVVKSWVDYDDHSDVTISIIKNFKLSNIRFYYYDPIKQDYVNCNVENGDATLHFDKGATESFIKIDFSYPDFKTSDPVAYFMNENIQSEIVFHKSSFNLEKPKNAASAQRPDVPNDNIITKNFANKYQVDSKTASDCEAIMRKVENAIKQRDPNSVREYFTDECFKDFQSILGYNTPRNRMVYRITDNNIQYSFIYFKNDIICRSIPLQLEYSSGMTFNRSLSFRFDRTDKLISSIAYRISNSAERDIVTKTKYKQWDEDARLTLITFLEDFQTAYMTKDLPYLNHIFSDDALIIVGHKIEKKNTENNFMRGDEYEMIQKSKADYMVALNDMFRKREYVNIRFTDVTVEESYRTKNIFGISLAQDFAADTYVDNGYLFLYVDLRKEPIIYVRTWQPEKTTVEEQFTLRNVQ